MRKILFVTRHDPFVRTGGGLATKAFLNAFTTLYPDLVELVIADNCRVNDSVSVCKIHKVKRRSFIMRFCSLLTGHLHRFTPFLKELIKRNDYSLCVLDGSVIGGDMVEILNGVGIKTITIHHNFEQEYHVDSKTIESFFGFFPYYIRRNERNAYLYSSLNLFLTQADYRKFLNYYGFPQGISHVIGCFEPQSESYNCESVLVKNSKKVLVITGAMDAYQTVNSVMDYYGNYWSETLRILDDFLLILAGRNPSTKILETIGRKENVVIVPNPVNISEVVVKGDIFVCPVNIGGGLKLRLMDGLRNGLLILVHEVSARGYDMFLNEPWFKVYHDVASYAEGLMELNKLKQVEYSRQIRAKYNEYFSFEAGLSRLSDALADLE